MLINIKILNSAGTKGTCDEQFVIYVFYCQFQLYEELLIPNYLIIRLLTLLLLTKNTHKASQY